MAYDLLILPTESEYRSLYLDTYCNFANPIYTHDGIWVKFFPDKFDHAFFESHDWKVGDKSVFSTSRAQRILWIKEALQDPFADMRIGWDKKNKCYDKTNRVSIVVGDYVVVIWIRNATEGKFITAYHADNSIGKILKSPIWTP